MLEYSRLMGGLVAKRLLPGEIWGQHVTRQVAMSIKVFCNVSPPQSGGPLPGVESDTPVADLSLNLRIGRLWPEGKLFE